MSWLNLLKIVNAIIFNDEDVQENLCFVGGIPKINKFASKKFPREIRLEAAAFVRQMYQTSRLILQMFVSAGGLSVLVDFLEDDYDDDRELVLIGVNGIWSVFELQGSTPKNDFCRILSRNSVLEPLSLVLNRVLSEPSDSGEQKELSELCQGRIASIFFIFSQAENYVKDLVAEVTVLRRVLKNLKRMSSRSASDHAEVHQESVDAIDDSGSSFEQLQRHRCADQSFLTMSMNKPQFREVSNQILNTIYNLCQAVKLARQEEAALVGIIPISDQDCPARKESCQRVCSADTLRHGTLNSGRQKRALAEQRPGLLYIAALRSVLASHSSGCYLHMATRGDIES